MGHINYQCLRGKVHAVAPAEPPTQSHLWILLEANGEQWFATINVRSDKDAPGEPPGKSYLYYLVDADFEHPHRASILARPDGLSPVERSFAGGAMDFQRAGLFDPTAMRVLPTEGPGHDGLVQRLTGLLQLAKDQDCDVFFYGNAFAKDNPHQTDAAFGYTPPTPFGLDNVHMAQGNFKAINVRLHENGVWHDGACFVWDGRARRMTAIFLSFQSQGWHTNDTGDLIYGVNRRRGARVRLFERRRRADHAPAAGRSAHDRPSGAGRRLFGCPDQYEPCAARSDRLEAPCRRRAVDRPARLDPRAGRADEPHVADGRSRQLWRRPHARQPGRPQRPLRGLSRRRPCGRLECEPRLIRPGPAFRLWSRPPDSRGSAGCAPKSPMLGNARLWGRSGPRALFLREAESSRIPRWRRRNGLAARLASTPS